MVVAKVEFLFCIKRYVNKHMHGFSFTKRHGFLMKKTHGSILRDMVSIMF
jgi:hypothetical protein